jgi:hypothetical protein
VSLHIRFLAAYTTDTHESSFWKRHQSTEIHWPTSTEASIERFIQASILAGKPVAQYLLPLPLSRLQSEGSKLEVRTEVVDGATVLRVSGKIDISQARAWMVCPSSPRPRAASGRRPPVATAVALGGAAAWPVAANPTSRTQSLLSGILLREDGIHVSRRRTVGGLAPVTQRFSWL